MNFGVVTLTVVELFPFTNEQNLIFFCFGSLTKVYFNQMLLNLYTIPINSKYRSSMNFGGVTSGAEKLESLMLFNCSRVMLLYKC